MNAELAIKLLLLQDLNEQLVSLESILKGDLDDTLRTVIKNQITILKVLQKLVESDNKSDFQIK